MIEHELSAVRYLRQVQPEDWDRAAAAARRLADCARYLPWGDRVRVFDELFWAEANFRLSTEDVTAIVNRQAGRLGDQAEVGAYSQYCSAVVATALMQLDEPLGIADEGAALIHYFSAEPAHREAALEWVGGGHHHGLASRLPAWPGCAFLLLILSPSDSAESFIARDAFWAAMLGQP